MAAGTRARLILPLAFWLGLGLALVALWASGQAARAWDTTRAARPLPLLLVVACGMLLPAIHALRWRNVMRALGTDVPPVLAVDLTVSASLLNYASPGYLGAPAKALLANRTAGAPWGAMALSMAFEQGLDFLVLLAGSALALALLGPGSLGRLLPGDGRALAIGAVAVLLGALALAAALLHRRARRLVARVVEAFRVLGGRVDRGTVAALTLAYWLVQAVTVALLLWALRLPLDVTTLLALATLPLLLGQVVPLPGGLGAREAAIVALAGVTGASAAELLGLAVLQRVLLVGALPLALAVARLPRLAQRGSLA